MRLKDWIESRPKYLGEERLIDTIVQIIGYGIIAVCVLLLFMFAMIVTSHLPY